MIEPGAKKVVESILKELGEPPWDLRVLARQSGLYLQDVIQTLPGYEVVELIYELKRSLALLDSFVKDIVTQVELFRGIDELDVLDKWFDSNSKLLSIRFNVSKAVFGAASAAAALRDLQGHICGMKDGRIVKGKEQYVCASEYKNTLTEISGESGLADFVFHLRNYTNHRRFLTSDGMVSTSINGTRKKFVLLRSKLLKSDFWKPASLAFIRSNRDVDVEQVFVDYSAIANELVNWFVETLRREHKEKVDEYARCHEMVFYVLHSYSISFRAIRNDSPPLEPFSAPEIADICSKKDRYSIAMKMKKHAEKKVKIDPIELYFMGVN